MPIRFGVLGFLVAEINPVLCFIQGIGEFLPISSSGHILVFEKFFPHAEAGLDFRVTLHFGSLLALLIYFFKDVVAMISGVWALDVAKLKGHARSNANERYRDLAWTLVLASIPTLIAGLAIKKTMGSPPENLTIIGVSSILFGLSLAMADANSLKDTEINFKSGFLIGLAQCLAVIPGSSRSGLCLTMARFLGISRERATRFAFLMAIPVLLGAFVLTLIDAENPGAILGGRQLVPIAIVTGLGVLAIRFFFWFIERFGLFAFGIYRVVFGIALLVFF